MPWVEFWYNSNFHSSMGTTYGRKAHTVVRFILGETKLEEVARERLDKDEALKQLKFNLTRAQNQMCKYANKSRQHKEF